MDTIAVGAGERLLSLRGCTDCAKQGETPREGASACLSDRADEGGLMGLPLFFRHRAFRISRVFTLEQQETSQPFPPSLSWLIVHDISMGRVLQGPVLPVPPHCIDVKNGIHHLIYSKDSGLEICFETDYVASTLQTYICKIQRTHIQHRQSSRFRQLKFNAVRWGGDSFITDLNISSGSSFSKVTQER